MFTVRLLSLFSLLFLCNICYSQRDTVFWFAAPDVSSAVGQTPIGLEITTYAVASNVTISQPANLAFVPIIVNIPANATNFVDLSAFISAIESPNGGVIANTGLKISATEQINVSYLVSAAQNKERFALKGSRGLGTNFYLPFQKHWDNAAVSPATYSGFEIVATEDNTTVLITPRTAIIGAAANTTFSVTLNKGQTYSCRDMSNLATTSLAGSIVSSNKKIAVTLFDGQLIESTCQDMIGDQMISTQYVGTDYAINKGTATIDRVYVLGTQNGTSIDVFGASTTNYFISAGETVELPVTDEVIYIKATHPIYVMHVSGFGCELNSSIVPSLNCKGNNEIAFTRANADSLGLVLITRTGFETDFLLNGSATFITGAEFTDVPGTLGQYKSARIFFNTTDIPVSSYNIVTNNSDIFAMGIMAGNGTNGSSYGFITDFQAAAYSNAGSDDTVCANIDFPLNGLVGGGVITGSWSSNGYGSFQNGLNSVPNTYIPSPLDTLISPITLILSTTGFCPVAKDTMFLLVTPAPIVNANVDQEICENNAVIQLAGNVSGGATSGYWETNGTGSFVPDSSVLNAQYVSSPADIVSGNVQFVLFSADNSTCAVATDTMNVIYTMAATVTISNPDTITVCANNATVPLSGTVSGPTTTGKWTTSGSGIFSPNNSSLTCNYLPSVADTTAGSVWIYLESTSNGNCFPVFDSVLILITDNPVVNAGPNQLICANDSEIQLNGTVNGSFNVVWTGGTGVFTNSNTDLAPTYQPTPAEIASGTLILNLESTNNGNCLSNSDVIQINFVAPPFANFNASTVCEGAVTQFSDFSLPGSGTITNWLWNFGGGQTTTLQNPSLTYSTTGINQATLIVTNSFGCKDTIVNNVTVYENPVADFNYLADCINNQVTINFTDASSSVDPIANYFYDFGGQGTANSANVTQVFNSDGSYEVIHIVSTGNGCSDTISQVVIIDPLPIAGFYYNTDGGLNVGAEFNFIDTSSYGVSYSWTFGDGGNSNLQDPSHTYFSNGNYYITQYVTNSLGCVDSAIRFISINTVTTEIETLIPTIISPNGDGKNDVWKLEFLDLLYPNVHVEIYNEWGQLLFESDGYDFPWDGTYNGEPVPDGNYMFIIELNEDVEPSLYKGVLMVLRKRI